MQLQVILVFLLLQPLLLVQAGTARVFVELSASGGRLVLW
jgi:hypothetical protein